jgi:aconitate hydratase
VFEGDANWKGIKVPAGDLYAWDEKSTYIKKPPFFDGLTMTPKPITDVVGARALAVLGDSITTDHISPAGDIAEKGPAGDYLKSLGVPKADFNSYGARRGNHEVMIRGTFANIRLKNLMVPGVEGGVTVHVPTGKQTSIFDASMQYQKAGTPLVIIGGKEYGTGSSRDWAAKGTMLLGVRAVLVESFERIHRSNLVGMGVLPLQFLPGESRVTHNITGKETFEIHGLASIKPKQKIDVKVTYEDGKTKNVSALVRIDTPNELEYYKNGGILQYVLRQQAKS